MRDVAVTMVVVRPVMLRRDLAMFSVMSNWCDVGLKFGAVIGDLWPQTGSVLRPQTGSVLGRNPPEEFHLRRRTC
jgi:hypothetical protein